MVEALRDPLALLRRMQAESRRHSPGLPEQVEPVALWTGLGFRLGDLRFVTPLHGVAEVLPCPPVTAVPGTRPWLRGVTNVRGQLYTVVDLPQFFGRPAVETDEHARLLIMNIAELSTALLVDEVYGLRHFEEQQDRRAVVERGDPALAYAEAAFERDGLRWCVFDMQALADSPDFRRVAA
jgi:twitching motility protein PilI